jgi:hypothetical protein
MEILCNISSDGPLVRFGDAADIFDLEETLVVTCQDDPCSHEP